MSQGPIAVQPSLLSPAGIATPVKQDGNGNQRVIGGGAGYQACAAGGTQALGAAGKIGDVLNKLVIIPGTTSPGAVQIKDGANAAITVFAGGATSVADLSPREITLDIASVAGGWSIVTGANVTALATGQFTA